MVEWLGLPLSPFWLIKADPHRGGSISLEPGAHLLLQTRVKTLNGELGSLFKRWYPDLEVEEMPEAA
jgi:hypothetical protein